MHLQSIDAVSGSLGRSFNAEEEIWEWGTYLLEHDAIIRHVSGAGQVDHSVHHASDDSVLYVEALLKSLKCHEERIQLASAHKLMLFVPED